MNRVQHLIDKLNFHYNNTLQRDKELKDLPSSRNRQKSLEYSRKKTLSLVNDVKVFGTTNHILKIRVIVKDKREPENIQEKTLDCLYTGVTEEEAKSLIEFNLSGANKENFEFIYVSFEEVKCGIYEVNDNLKQKEDGKKRKAGTRKKAPLRPSRGSKEETT